MALQVRGIGRHFAGKDCHGFRYCPLSFDRQCAPPRAAGPSPTTAPAVTARSPAPTVAMSGLVRTADGLAVPGATLRVIEGVSGRAWVTWTDESGHFSLPGLAPGHYRIEAAQLGFESSAQEFDLTSSAAPITLAMKVASLDNIQQTGQLTQPVERRGTGRCCQHRQRTGSRRKLCPSRNHPERPT